ncbi:hypothetical protein [Plesiomonas shigelloides]|uniref:hypothetical protein n=1 Tax=Plesiomonas shigelloides TaxID=703 RepID=UPI00387F0A2E
MSISDLKRLIEEKKNTAVSDAELFDPQLEISEFVEHLNRLYSLVEESIRTLLDDGLIAVSRHETSIEEESLGVYPAPCLVLSINSDKVTFTPIGTMLIGCKGRVDVKGPASFFKLMLLRKSVRHASDLISVSISVDGQPNSPSPAKPVERPAIDAWEWKVLPSDVRVGHFQPVTTEVVVDMISKVLNG